MAQQGLLQDESISDQAVARAIPKKRPRTRSLAAMVVFLLFAAFIYANFRMAVVSGTSMLPYFRDGERLTVSSAYWLIGPIKDKDVVVIKDNNKTGYIIKRVYRLGGEKVDYPNSPHDWSLANPEFTVPAGEVYVLGDNRSVSEDSRFFGPVPLSKVIGKVIKQT